MYCHQSVSFVRFYFSVSGFVAGAMWRSRLPENVCQTLKDTGNDEWIGIYDCETGWDEGALLDGQDYGGDRQGIPFGG